MKIVFVIGPSFARKQVCKKLLPKAGIKLHTLDAYDYLRPPKLSEEELERKNIGHAVSDQFVIDIVEKIIDKKSKTLTVDTVLVINGFPRSEVQTDYLAATYKNNKQVAILHIEPMSEVYSKRCKDPRAVVNYEYYDNFIRPAALRLAEDLPVFTLQHEQVEDMAPFMLPKILRMFTKLKCRWNVDDCPRCFCEVTRQVQVPSKLSLFDLVMKHPKILLECPHVDAGIIHGFSQGVV